MKRFLGRQYDERAMTYRHNDGSGGVITEEMKLEFHDAVDHFRSIGAPGLALGVLSSIKDRAAKNPDETDKV